MPVYGASKKTFSLPWLVRLVEIDPLDPPQAPHPTWKQVHRRYYGADRIREDDLVPYNPAKMRRLHSNPSPSTSALQRT